ncbi:MAG: secretin and TonB N-terminal domain-containing protein, partial [Desulfobacteraceae bacterium]|nr:secretin and TonB N-terminal domain-containing protein [Desulfobacteraceae bacterium]
MRNSSLILLIFFIVIGCTSARTIENKVPIISNPVPPPPVEEKLEALTISAVEEEIKEPEKLYSLSFREADIHEILTVLARESRLNIVVDPDVTGKVTVDLKEVTLARALDCLLTPLGLAYKRDGNVIRVSPVRMQTRIFTLNYLTTKRVGKSVTSGTTGGREEAEGQTSNNVSSVTVTTSDTADLWKEIEEGLKSISSPEGRLVINKISGSILATDFPQNLARIAEFLETIEGSAQRQVMIETRIIEVTLSDEYQMGLNWAAVEIGDFPILSQTLGSASTIFQMGISRGDFSAFLDAMSKQGKIDILSSPKISTLNNQPAIIKVATEDVYWESETTYSEGVARISSTPRWITIGILMGVTPQIGSDGLIIMDIHPSVTEKTGESVSAEGDIAPILDVREVNAMVKVMDGQTIIIAGLLQKRKQKEITGVPFLEDVPLLGHLFKKTVETEKKTELIITLTPRIVVGNE